MANYFDRFDEQPIGNYFDKFDEEVVSNEPSTPEKKTSKLDMLGKVAGLSYRTTPLGILQTANDFGTQITDMERNYLGDKTLQLTGSPLAATAAYMTPDVANMTVANRLAAMPFKPAPTNELGKAAERIGYQPSMPQAIKNRDMAFTYDTLANMPGGAGVIAKHEARNQAAVNRAVSNAIGQKSDVVTGEVLANASDDLGNVRNTLRSQVNIPKGEPTILKSIEKSIAELKKSLKGTGQFKNDMERIKQGVQSGNISGEQYQIWRTDLRDAKDAAYRAGKSKLGEAYKNVLESLDDAARQVGSEAWRANDKQFAALNMVQKGNIVNPVTGDVSAPLLTNQMYRDFGAAAKQGRIPGPIADVATVTKGYPLLQGGSQTARREAYNSFFPWLMSPLSYVGAKFLTSSPYGLLRVAPYGVPAAGAIRGVADARLETEE